jgi:hypothetical protein
MDGRPVGNGRAGPIARLLQDRYAARIEETLAATRRWWERVGT